MLTPKLVNSSKKGVSGLHAISRFWTHGHTIPGYWPWKLTWFFLPLDCITTFTDLDHASIWVYAQDLTNEWACVSRSFRISSAIGTGSRQRELWSVLWCSGWNEKSAANFLPRLFQRLYWVLTDKKYNQLTPCNTWRVSRIWFIPTVDVIELSIFVCRYM